VAALALCAVLFGLRVAALRHCDWGEYNALRHRCQGFFDALRQEVYKLFILRYFNEIIIGDFRPNFDRAEVSFQEVSAAKRQESHHPAHPDARCWILDAGYL
jgi:hypothetical protein